MIKKYLTYIIESKKDDFKIGDRIIYSYNGRHIDGFKGKNKIYFGLHGKIIKNVGEISNYRLGIEFDEKIPNGHDCSVGKIHHCQYISPEYLKKEDSEYQKKFEKEREEKRLKHIENDPYGEEEWDD